MAEDATLRSDIAAVAMAMAATWAFPAVGHETCAIVIARLADRTCVLQHAG